MSKLLNINKNVAFVSCGYIDAICRPLINLLGEVIFNHVRIYKDNSRSMLMNSGFLPYNQVYYTSPELYQAQPILAMEQSKNNSEHLWYEFNDTEISRISRQQFNIDNGVTIIVKSSQYTDLYYIGSTRDNYEVVRLFMSSKDLMYKFILFYQDKARKLIQSADKERFTLQGYSNSVRTILGENCKESKINRLAENLAIHKIYFDEIANGCYLTKREAQCFYFVLKNKTAKEIGLILNISCRTVESYLEKVKNKFNCTTKAGLKQLDSSFNICQKLQYIAV